MDIIVWLEMTHVIQTASNYVMSSLDWGKDSSYEILYFFARNVHILF